MIDQSSLPSVLKKLNDLQNEIRRRSSEASPPVPRKNLLMNAGGAINQRNNANSGQTSGLFMADAWVYYTTDANFAGWANPGSLPTPAQIGNVVPYSFIMYRNAGTTFDTTNGYVIIRQTVEGYDWARVYQRPMVLSFWAATSNAGVYGGSILSGGNDRVYPFTFTIPVAGVWARYSIPVPADTTGTFGLTNGIGAYINWAAMCGSANSRTPGAWTSAASIFSGSGISNALLATTNNLQIAAAKLEPGYVATPFEPDDIHSDLGRCLRRLWVIGGPLDNAQYLATDYELASLRGSSVGTASIIVTGPLPVPMRTGPALQSMTSLWYFWPSTGGAYQIVSPSLGNYSNMAIRIDASLGTALPGANYVGFVQSTSNLSARQTIVLSAELA